MSIDLLIVLVFFLITFLIGVIDRRKVTLPIYWVNDRSTGKYILVATTLSTFVGAGAIFGTAAVTFSGGGVMMLVASLSFAVYFYIFGHFFAPKIREFGAKHGSFSIPDYLRTRYSARTGLAGAVAILVTFVLYLALQILANGTIVASLGGVDPRVATIVGGGIVVAYTTIGGLRADIRTDVFQFCVMLIIIFVLVPGVFIKGGGFSALCELPASFLSGRDFAPYPVIAMAFLFIGAMVLTSADTWQRAFAADSAANAKWAMKITSILVLCFSATAVFLGVYGKIIMPGVNPDNVVAALIKLTLPAGIYGLVVAGLFATIMSSADTVLLVTSMTIVHDFYQKFCRTQPSPEKVLRLSRIITVILGVLAIGWALFVFSIVKLSFHSVSFFAAILPAIVFGFHAKRASEGAAFWSIVSGLITIFVFLFIAPVEAFIPGLLVSFLVFGIVQWAANSRTKG